MRSWRRRLWNWVPSRKPYCGTNKITKGKEDEEIKGKNMPICSCISYGIHKDNVLEVSKNNLGLSQGRIYRWWEDSWNASAESREFQLQRMKESKSVREYFDRLLSIAIKLRLLGSVLNDSRIVENLLVTVPERFEATITTLKNTKDLSKISLAELLNALQAQEQRRVMRQDGAIGALTTKHQGYNRNKKKTYPPFQHCGKKGHPPFKCWRRPDAKCIKCNQLWHEVFICRNQNEQQDVDAQIANEEEDELFVATGFSRNISSASWLIDSGCTNHMTYDKELFKELKWCELILGYFILWCDTLLRLRF